jgi:hypothetical protein
MSVLEQVRALPDGLVFVITVDSFDNDLTTKQSEYYESLKADLTGQQASVVLVSNAGTPKGDHCLLGNPTELTGFVPKLAGKEQPGSHLFVLKKSADQLTYLDLREKPENQYNWMEIALQFAQNFNDTVPDSSNNYWKWGQVVQEDGEYLCVDCGYIIELKQGQIYPICEVCLSGDPAGPSGPTVGFWEKV